MRFRCPHCRERTLGFWPMMKANGWRPGVCPRCGGKVVPASWATLPALIVFPFFFFLPLLMVGDLSETRFYALLAVAAVISVAASFAVVLMVPLLRHGSRLAQWDAWTYLGAIIAVVAYAVAKQFS
jgi:hypothetical protein